MYINTEMIKIMSNFDYGTRDVLRRAKYIAKVGFYYIKCIFSLI